MRMVEVHVSTPLSIDGATINLIEVGQPVSITISINSQNIDGIIVSPQDCGIHSSSDGSKCEPQISLPTVNVSGRKTGHSAHSDMAVTSLGKGVQLIKFKPKVPDDYSLSVCNRGQHIQGSPFTIKALEKGTLDGH